MSSRKQAEQESCELWRWTLAMTCLASIFGFLAPAGSGSAAPADVPARADQLRQDIREMISLARDRVFPAMVNIHVVTVQYWGGKEQKGQAVGSGTIISPDGYVLTNQHVSNNGKKFTCTLADRQEVAAKLVGEDPLTDLAVLKLNLTELKTRAGSPPFAHFGNSDELEIGDYVMVMGSPFALSRSVTLGIVSNPQRVFAGGLGSEEVEDMELEAGQRTGIFTRWIQHDAVLNPGNSGGPLVNLKGEIVGVNELGGGTMGFAIPSGLAKAVAEMLIKDGEVVRSSIGVSFKQIQKTGLSAGVLVNSVTKGGPADKAGIRAGDVVVKVNGEAITVRFPEEVPPLLKRIADLPVGTDIALSYSRNGKTAETRLVTERLQKDKGDEKAFRAWGMTAREITPKMAQDWRLENTEGAMVGTVREGGPAQVAEPRLGGGDVIRAIDGKKIRKLSDFVDQYKQFMDMKAPPEFLLVEFDRRGKNYVTLLKPKPDKDEDRPREVAKAWIGIATQPLLKQLAEKSGRPDARGYRITRVYPKTEAARSDLRVGDAILALNGAKLSPVGMQDAGLLNRQVRQLNIGETARLTVLRGGKTMDVEVALERTRVTPEEARRDRNRDFEMVVREVTFFDRDESRWGDEVNGVIAEEVEPAGWAGLGGVMAGDLIQRIDGYEIAGLTSYRKAMEAVTAAQPQRVVVVVLRGVRTHLQYLEPEWKPISDEAGKTASRPGSEPSTQHKE